LVTPSKPSPSRPPAGAANHIQMLGRPPDNPRPGKIVDSSLHRGVQNYPLSFAIQRYWRNPG
jgi:hypothetical protein